MSTILLRKSSSSCSDAVVAKHYALGQRLGIPGTPMIVLRDGTSLGGYMPPDKLLAVLEEHGVGAGGKSHEQWLAAGSARQNGSLNYPRHSRLTALTVAGRLASL